MPCMYYTLKKIIQFACQDNHSIEKKNYNNLRLQEGLTLPGSQRSEP